jgi:hypothetical protein
MHKLIDSPTSGAFTFFTRLFFGFLPDKSAFFDSDTRND